MTPHKNQRLFEENFVARAKDECWIWEGRTSPDGYGKFRWQGREHRAHRWAYELAYGEIPTGLIVMHTCDVSTCVNPAHLKVGTHRENTRDMMRKGRQGFPNAGTRRPGCAPTWRKLTDRQVKEIRALEGQFSYREIAERFNVSAVLVSRIIRGLYR